MKYLLLLIFFNVQSINHQYEPSDLIKYGPLAANYHVYTTSRTFETYSYHLWDTLEEAERDRKYLDTEYRKNLSIVYDKDDLLEKQVIKSIKVFNLVEISTNMKLNKSVGGKMKQLQWGKTADKQMNWQEAMDYCNKLGKGWRLPTIEELASCIDYSKYNPASKMNFKSDYYWSSTTDVYSTGNAWLVGFSVGYVGSFNKALSLYVRPVRGGQCGNLKIKKSEIKSEAVKLLKGMINKLGGK